MVSYCLLTVLLFGIDEDVIKRQIFSPMNSDQSTLEANYSSHLPIHVLNKVVSIVHCVSISASLILSVQK